MTDTFRWDAAAAQEDAYHNAVEEREQMIESLKEAHDIISGLSWWINRFYPAYDGSCPVCGAGADDYEDKQCALCRADKWLAESKVAAAPPTIANDYPDKPIPF